MSHELKTPLTAVRVASDLLSGSYDQLTPSQREVGLRVLRKGVDRLDQITERSLDYTRLNSGTGELEGQETDIGEMVQDLSEFVSLAFDQKQQTLEVDVSPNLPALFVDPVHIERVFLSRLENANRYTPQGGHIRIQIHERIADIYAAVSDDGPGIPAEERQHIFHEYYRGSHTDRLPSRGIGLGLAIAKRLVEIHGGEMGIDSRPSLGTTIYFTLPLANPL